MCILKRTAEVNARAIAERRDSGMFHLIPLTRDAEGGHKETREEKLLLALTKNFLSSRFQKYPDNSFGLGRFETDEYSEINLIIFLEITNHLPPPKSLKLLRQL